MRITLFLLLTACAAVACGQGSSSRPGGGSAADTPEGGTSASADGGDAGVVPTGPSYCTTLDPAPFFCVDFDDGAAPDQRFTRAVGATNESGALKFTDTDEGAFVAQEADPVPHWTVIRLGFAVRTLALPADGRLVVARIGQHQTDLECRLDLELNGDVASLGGSGATAADLTWKPRVGESARIELTLEEQSDGGMLRGSVTVDGKPATAAPVMLGCARLPGPPRVLVGRINASGTTDLRYDDIVMDGSE